VKILAKRNVKKTKRSIKKEAKKTNRYGLLLLSIALIAILAMFVYCFQFFKSNNNYVQVPGLPQQPGIGVETSVSGSCSKNNQCFITHCKGQVKSCVNTTQLTYYSKNCNNYLDWVVDQQDSSVCACVQNACKML
jgi:hypothetical protein